MILILILFETFVTHYVGWIRAGRNECYEVYKVKYAYFMYVFIHKYIHKISIFHIQLKSEVGPMAMVLEGRNWAKLGIMLSYRNVICASIFYSARCAGWR